MIFLFMVKTFYENKNVYLTDLLFRFSQQCEIKENLEPTKPKISIYAIMRALSILEIS